jgi:predicted DNA-binding protein with PD1-like motif
VSHSGSYRAYRLVPGTDLREFIETRCRDEKLDAGVILSMVGSLKVAAIRFAGVEQPAVLQGPFEIVSVTGTVCADGPHIHLSIADKEGKVIAGHLALGSLVNTTVELVILDISSEWEFERVVDPVSGDKELQCTPKKSMMNAE